jgi:hypothetical protein
LKYNILGFFIGSPFSSSFSSSGSETSSPSSGYTSSSSSSGASSSPSTGSLYSFGGVLTQVITDEIRMSYLLDDNSDVFSVLIA